MLCSTVDRSNYGSSVVRGELEGTAAGVCGHDGVGRPVWGSFGRQIRRVPRARRGSREREAARCWITRGEHQIWKDGEARVVDWWSDEWWSATGSGRSPLFLLSFPDGGGGGFVG
ncbi:proline-rich receptor-like protein kinase PERK9 [Iris pallida]|uniref:Proline-rich receptor-like protein kinase PERK9 n=1 Tax=Iris pallida TaxID=29817 RepID=A0AAX6G518_IRIPA|nr:proline-rich receptor-like protein kinase PERK9 [Iris pallida]KAJ6823779.1 proline-rich receptor-like protein kinase PERK9 [Iris pallida]